jgi:hypothetical protein
MWWLFTYDIYITSRMITVAVRCVSRVESSGVITLLMCVNDLG